MKDKNSTEPCDKIIILYTLPGCKVCRKLEKKMMSANIPFEKKEMDMEIIYEMTELGFTSAPILSIDSNLLDYESALTWLEEQIK